MAITRVTLNSKLLPLAGIVSILWMVTIGPVSSAATAGMVRAGVTVLALLALILILESRQLAHTVAMWVAFGATLVLALLVAFSAGLWGLVPLAGVVVYDLLHWESFGTNATWAGAILATVIMLLMVPL